MNPRKPYQELQFTPLFLTFEGNSGANIQMDDVKVEIIGSWKVIEVTFKYKHKQRNEEFQYYISSKFFLMFVRYLEDICQDTLAAGNLQFLKKWN